MVLLYKKYSTYFKNGVYEKRRETLVPLRDYDYLPAYP